MESPEKPNAVWNVHPDELHIWAPLWSYKIACPLCSNRSSTAPTFERKWVSYGINIRHLFSHTVRYMCCRKGSDLGARGSWFDSWPAVLQRFPEIQVELKALGAMQVLWSWRQRCKPMSNNGKQLRRWQLHVLYAYNQVKLCRPACHKIAGASTSIEDWYDAYDMIDLIEYS